eukprot:362174-Chlamydomonas_euryale.AAC.4
MAGGLNKAIAAHDGQATLTWPLPRERPVHPLRCIHTNPATRTKLPLAGAQLLLNVRESSLQRVNEP